MYFHFQSLKIYYEKEGTGIPLIFLHGWGANIKYIKNITNELTNKYCIYLIDLPGFGESEEPHKPYNIFDYVEMLNSFIKKNNLNKVILMGHSFGGKITTLYSGMYQNVNRLILIDSSGINHFSIKNKAKILLYKTRKKIYKLTKQVTKYQILLQTAGSVDFQSSTPVMKKTMALTLKTDVRKYLKSIKCETLIIWGNLDTITPKKDAKILNKKIKNSGVVYIPRAKHFPFIDNEAYFKRVLKKYLEVN